MDFRFNGGNPSGPGGNGGSDGSGKKNFFEQGFSKFKDFMKKKKTKNDADGDVDMEDMESNYERSFGNPFQNQRGP
jgi:hypothetical protein